MFWFVYYFEKLSKVFPPLRKLHFRFLRKCIRGHYILRKNGQLHVPAELKRKLEETRVLPDGKTLSPYIYGSIATDHDLIVRQFLLSRYFCPYSRFNYFFLAAVGSTTKDFRFPLPLSWRRLMNDANYPSNTRMNSIIWWLEIVFHWIRGQLRIFSIFFGSLWALITRSNWPSNYAFILEAFEEMLPKEGYPIPERNFFNWYATWKEREASISLLVHTVQTARTAKVSGITVQSVKGDLPFLPSYSSLGKFAFWGVSSGILSLGKMMTGKWWDALLLAEGAKAAMVRYNPKERLAREYFFMYDWTYRPIWTYWAESMGSKIHFYFYSTNSEQFKTRSGYIPLLFDWRPINWPSYVVWDRYQKDFIARHSRTEPQFHIVGPLHLSGRVPSEIYYKERSLAVFDVMPMRLSLYATFGLSNEYYVRSTCIKFVQDIAEIASELNCHVYLKSKRMVSRRVDASYRYLLNNLQRHSNVTVLSGDYPAETLIRKTAISVSMPWTSTALMAEYFAKPACYYDSAETLLHDDRGAHGIPVCIGKNELRHYLMTLLDETAAHGTAVDDSKRHGLPPIH